MGTARDVGAAFLSTFVGSRTKKTKPGTMRRPRRVLLEAGPQWMLLRGPLSCVGSRDSCDDARPRLPGRKLLSTSCAPLEGAMSWTDPRSTWLPACSLAGLHDELSSVGWSPGSSPRATAPRRWRRACFWARVSRATTTPNAEV